MRRSLAALLCGALVLTAPGPSAYAAAGKLAAPEGVALPSGALVAAPALPSLPAPLALPAATLAAAASVFARPVETGARGAPATSAAVPVARAAASAAPAAPTAASAVKAFSALDLTSLSVPAASAETVGGLGAALERVLTGGASLSAVDGPPTPAAGRTGGNKLRLLHPAPKASVDAVAPRPLPAAAAARVARASARARGAKTVWLGVTAAGALAALGFLTASAGPFALVSWKSLATLGLLFSGLVLKAREQGDAKQPLADGDVDLAVQTLSSAAAIPAPPVVRWEEAMPNAAAGGSPKDGHVRVTPAIMNALPLSQLTGVLAHELTHLKNRDTRLAVVSRGLGTLLALSLVNLHAPLAVFVSAMAGMALVQAATDRAMERLADLGAASLTGRPEELARALLRLEFWVRVMKGRSTPVGTPGFNQLTENHPSVLRRVESLARLVEPSTPRKWGGPGSRKSVYASAAAFLALVARPLLLGLTLLALPLWAWPLMLLARKAGKLLIARVNAQGDAAGVAADRVRGYLEHPSAEIRAWAAEALAYARTLRLPLTDKEDRARVKARLAELP